MKLPTAKAHSKMRGNRGARARHDTSSKVFSLPVANAVAKYMGTQLFINLSLDSVAKPILLFYQWSEFGIKHLKPALDFRLLANEAALHPASTIFSLNVK